jgi:hypothetical protein
VCAGTPCAAGSFGPAAQISATAATCTQCPSGTFSASAGSTACTPCPAGTASFAAGASSASSCTACSGSTFALSGAANCASCPAGSTFTSTTTPCTPSASLGPNDNLAFYLSGSSADSKALRPLSPTGISYSSDRLSTVGGALTLAAGSALDASFSFTPATMPVATAALTIATWLLCPAAGLPLSTVFEFGRPGVSLNSREKIGIQVQGAGLVSTPVPGSVQACDGRWHHVAYTYAAGSTNNAPTLLRRFVDGVAAPTTARINQVLPIAGSSREAAPPPVPPSARHCNRVRQVCSTALAPFP